MASGTMTCDRCNRANCRVLFHAKFAKQNPGPMGGTRIVEQEWCPECVACSFPAGIYAEAEA